MPLASKLRETEAARVLRLRALVLQLASGEHTQGQ
jgi:hypothetical protein